ncbi:Os08g0376100 [Oryza sativa Japonica Group]|uniref:Os08g0376100 protein n=1 Tax=Oryza sativa subsp. japonica TaxID=39947 RepID=A0A0P0XF71_ORYSJ|nr:Os08g0376100 [Oryza sativa Japonica Group]
MLPPPPVVIPLHHRQIRPPWRRRRRRHPTTSAVGSVLALVLARSSANLAALSSAASASKLRRHPRQTQPPERPSPPGLAGRRGFGRFPPPNAGQSPCPCAVRRSEAPPPLSLWPYGFAGSCSGGDEVEEGGRWATANGAPPVSPERR